METQSKPLFSTFVRLFLVLRIIPGTLRLWGGRWNHWATGPALNPCFQDEGSETQRANLCTWHSEGQLCHHWARNPRSSSPWRARSLFLCWWNWGSKGRFFRKWTVRSHACIWLSRQRRRTTGPRTWAAQVRTALYQHSFPAPCSPTSRHLSSLWLFL